MENQRPQQDLQTNDEHTRIARRVLDGEDCTKVAKAKGLSPACVRRIVKTVCRDRNLDGFQCLPSWPAFKIEEAREWKRFFFKEGVTL